MIGASLLILKSPAMTFFSGQKPLPTQVVNGRFELERDGNVAYLEYSLTGKILELIHTEVPESLRGTGVASELIQSALDWARENRVKVDVICPVVAHHMSKHPEYSDLLLR